MARLAPLLTTTLMFLFVSSTALSEKRSEQPMPRLSVRLEDGSCIVGQTRARTLEIHSAALGRLDVALGKVQTIALSDDRSSATVTLRTGEVLRGSLPLSQLKLSTSLGKVTVSIGQIVHVESAQIPGLVAWFPCNGTPVDQSGNGNHGTVHGAVPAKDRLGLPTMAYYFHSAKGNDNHIDCGEAGALGVGGLGKSFTISLWANPAREGKEHSHAFGMGVPNVNECVTLGLGDGAATAFLSFGGEGNSVRAGGAPVGEWHHWVGTYDAKTNTRRIYRDATVAAENQAPEDFPGRGRIYIGNSPWMNSPFAGAIDEVRVYSRALSESEVQELYWIERPADE